MSDAAGAGSFELQAQFDGRELLGARWWQQQLAAEAGAGAGPAGAEVTRRQALQRFLVLGGAVAVGGTAFAALRGCSRASASVLAPALELQRSHGWAVDGAGESLAWPDATGGDVEGRAVTPERLEGLGARLRPAPTLRPWYNATLYQAVEGPEQATLRRSLRPICSAAMRNAFAAGEAVGELFAGAGAGPEVALVADLSGPESVAFAAGARKVFAAVSTFGNWPHPRGVVPAHLTLAAAVFYAPLLLTRPDDPARPPVFVLDRARLDPYHNEADRFDNRYAATLPDADALARLGIARVLYVVPAGATAELDDLNATFDHWREAGIEVRLLSLAQFAPAPADPAATAPPPPAAGRPGVVRHCYCGSLFGASWFWAHYPWYRPAAAGAPAPPPAPAGAAFVPTRRATMFERGPPAGLGLVHDREREQQLGSQSGGGSWGRSGGRSFYA